MSPKVLVVLTSYGSMSNGQDTKPTGWYLPEFSHPYDVLAAHNVDVTVASPKGGEAPLDPGSAEMFKEDPSCANFLQNSTSLWKQTAKLSSFLGKSAEYDALFYPGGHGPMFDLATDADSIALIKEFAAAGKPVAAVCHGPAVLTNVDIDGKNIMSGKEVTGFSNAEEEMMQLTSYMPFLLETKMKDVGGVYKKAAEPLGEYVLVQDGGKLITGQNPASAKGVGEAIVKSIGA
ncbi:ThiJ/PfpI family protein [Xylariaceae sp. FL0016]|nr:ThiJ/PfpI family protein [Xylariaceae sp. FL0016]